MFKLLIGKPGAGKSYVMLKEIVDELRNTNRMIVTNLDLKQEDLFQYLMSEYGESFEMCSRIIKIEHTDLPRFWTFRQDAKNAEGVKVAGCAFFLDELHRYFNARHWNSGDKGQECCNYVTAHRHYGDSILASTQSTGFLDKMFIRIVQEFILIRNQNKERWGWFRAPGVFRYYSYNEPPVSANVKPFYKGTFKLDTKKLANCYRTDGLCDSPGLARADKDEKAKGMPFWVAPAIFAGIAAIAIFIVHQGPGFVANFFLNTTRKIAYTGKETVVKKQTETTVKEIINEEKPTNSVAVASVAVQNKKEEKQEEKLYVKGHSRINGKYWVALSDGRVIMDSQDYGDNPFWRQKCGAEVLQVDGRGAMLWLDGKYQVVQYGVATVTENVTPRNKSWMR